jgi:prolyl oligopeptidase
MTFRLAASLSRRSRRSSLSFAALAALSALSAACGASNAPAAAPGPAPVPPAAPPPPPSVPAAAQKPAYPPADKQPVVDLYRDVRVTDDYRWLENWDDAKVKAWSEAENTFTRQALDAAPGRSAIHARVEQLLDDPSPSWRSVVVRKGKIFAMEYRPPKAHPSLVLLTSLDAAPDKTERVLVDPSVLDPSGSLAIGWYEPTPDGTKVAVSLYKGGGERGDVHVFDVATGKEAKDAVPQSDGEGEGRCLAWKADGSGFYYTHAAREADAPKDGDYQRIYFHKLGDAPEKDVLAVGKDSVRLAQWEVQTGLDGKSIVARMEYGDGGEYDQWLLGPSGKWTQIATKADGVKWMTAADGALYILGTKDAPRRKVLRTSLAKPSLATAEVLVPEGDAVIEDVLPAKSHLYVGALVGGVSRVQSFPLAKGKLGTPATLAVPAIASASDMVPAGGDDVVFAVVTYTEPMAWYRASAKEGSVTKTAIASTSKADFSGVEVAREECTSKDGTKVPVTILKGKGVMMDGKAPALLTAYGGFGISLTPDFRSSRLAWLEQGTVYAVANIRGGGEFGEAWHHAGNLTNKQNDFDDFYACAQHLSDAKYTSPEHLAIEGGSNGGLLMGAELTQHPEAFKAVVSHVGIYDMLRVERDPNGAFNTEEYGSVDDPKQFDALFAYSPYHHVKDGVAYPATLFLTGANDPRVKPYHSRKMVARLQAATSSNAPILLRTSASSGHGRGTALPEMIEQLTDVNAFLFQQLGVTYAAPK